MDVRPSVTQFVSPGQHQRVNTAPTRPVAGIHQLTSNQVTRAGGHLAGLQPWQVQQPQQPQQPQTSSQPQVAASLDSLFNMHIKCRQYRALDFAKLGNFNYVGQIKPTNLNLALYGFGSIKHFLALADGTLPPVDTAEYISRLQHCLNVFEISCLGSNLTDFDGYGWKVGREYDNKIVRDIEQGFKTWQNLDRSIDPTAWTYAKEVAPPKPKPQTAPKTDQTSQNKGSGSGKNCTTWNTFKQPGCAYEHNNPGESCIYQHNCSKCRAKNLVKKHKAWQCNVDEAGKQTSQQDSTTGAVNPASAPPPVVTSG